MQSHIDLIHNQAYIERTMCIVYTFSVLNFNVYNGLKLQTHSLMRSSLYDHDVIMR